jgi:TonB family protein
MKFKSAIFLAIFCAGLAHSQTEPPAQTARRVSVADFGLAYPLSNDWVFATELSRKKVESDNAVQNFDVLLSAVYVPKSKISVGNPFFTLIAYRPPATNCKRNLEAMMANSQKVKLEGGVTEFTAAGRDFYRLDGREHDGRGRHNSTICTASNGHLLVWYAGAGNEKGMAEILTTLNSITVLPANNTANTAAPASSAQPRDGEEPAASLTKADRVRVSSGVTRGLLIKKVNPIYPPEARSAYIQGTVVLRAEISKTGDITDLELLDGPIELAGSAVDAVRQWKYRPYLLVGEPVTVETQITVNYTLSR